MTHFVDNVADGQHVQTLMTLLASVLLHQRHDRRAQVVLIIVRVNQGHAVLGVGPERF